MEEYNLRNILIILLYFYFSLNFLFPLLNPKLHSVVPPTFLGTNVWPIGRTGIPHHRQQQRRIRNSLIHFKLIEIEWKKYLLGTHKRGIFASWKINPSKCNLKIIVPQMELNFCPNWKCPKGESH